MSDNIISLGTERAKREGPDADFIKRDDYGRELFTFLLEYQFDGGTWSTTLWAYDMADADARIAAMRGSLELRGQVFTTHPA